MNIVITGICGFVGSVIARYFVSRGLAASITGLDNFSRRGSRSNLISLSRLGIDVREGDIRKRESVMSLPKADWVIDCAAKPEVLAGVDGRTSSLSLIEYNLFGTVNLLEYCKLHQAGFVMPSTSRVYSLQGLASIRLKVEEEAFVPEKHQQFADGVSMDGISESFSTKPPVSLYGTSKVASEQVALEYGAAFDFPVWIARCGVMAGAGQFAHATQGIFSYWVHSFREKAPLRYIGFGGTGYQVRDCFHPLDLARLIALQMNEAPGSEKPRVVNLGGGVENAMSLKQASDWCSQRFGEMQVAPEEIKRPFDTPWLVLDTSLARQAWGWSPQLKLADILAEVSDFAEEHPDWLSTARP